mmetsp:Transcript_43641/g.125984  ORF Transcript_43641/g.125984 Transcript_43641/m.125984 type:complete len:1289 (+) Transcript_43641:228-4094(+)
MPPPSAGQSYPKAERRAVESAEQDAMPTVQDSAVPACPCKIWFVVGGEDTGGIVVRLGNELGSPKAERRLSTGSFVRQLGLASGRLEYELVAGAGPAHGWVSVELNHKVLLVPKPSQAAAAPGPQLAAEVADASNAFGVGDMEHPARAVSEVQALLGAEEMRQADTTPQLAVKDDASMTSRRVELQEHTESEAHTEPLAAALNDDPSRPSATDRCWEVVGGEDKGGILVRAGLDLAMAKLDQRLSTGSFVRELAVFDERLHYQRITGTGPDSGWVSIRLNHKELLLYRGQWSELTTLHQAFRRPSQAQSVRHEESQSLQEVKPVANRSEAEELKPSMKHHEEKEVKQQAKEEREPGNWPTGADSVADDPKKDTQECKREHVEHVERGTHVYKRDAKTKSWQLRMFSRRRGNSEAAANKDEVDASNQPAAERTQQEDQLMTSEVEREDAGSFTKDCKSKGSESPILDMEPQSEPRRDEGSPGGFAVSTTEMKPEDEELSSQEVEAVGLGVCMSERQQEKDGQHVEESKAEVSEECLLERRLEYSEGSEISIVECIAATAKPPREEHNVHLKVGTTVKVTQNAAEHVATEVGGSELPLDSAGEDAQPPAKKREAADKPLSCKHQASEPSSQDSPAKEGGILTSKQEAEEVEPDKTDAAQDCKPEEPDSPAWVAGGTLWEVVGGADRGGILVREGLELSSEKEDERLATGSFVWELELLDERLHYQLIVGEGPSSGWVSTRLYHKELLVARMSNTTQPEAEQWLCSMFQQREEERRAREEAVARAHQEMVRKAEEEAQRRTKADCDKVADRMAQYRAQQTAFQAGTASNSAREVADQPPAPKAASRNAQTTSAPPEPAAVAKQWDRADLDRLETCLALDRSLSELTEGNKASMLDILNLKRHLIKKLRLEDDEQSELLALPEREDRLLAICDRVYEIEGLRDVVAAAVSEDMQRQVYGELLSNQIASVERLSRISTQEHRPLQASVLQKPLLDRLVSSARERLVERHRICELVPYGKSPFLVTAPHNAFLLRDGQPPHQLEQFTSGIAHQLAQGLGGEALCWTRQMQWRTAYRFSLGLRWKRSGAAGVYERALDPGLRDPNYMHEDEMHGSPWFQRMEHWASKHVRGVSGMSLHIDVHGCQDPPMWPTHAILGLGAMRQHVEGLAEDDPSRAVLLLRLQNFAAFVEPAVAHALVPLLGVPPHEAASLRGLAAAVTETGERAETLSGAWPPGTGRFTQTQQSVSHAGISHAVQLELSLTLRRALSREPWAVGKLAQAFRSSWAKAIAKESAV